MKQTSLNWFIELKEPDVWDVFDIRISRSWYFNGWLDVCWTNPEAFPRLIASPMERRKWG